MMFDISGLYTDVNVYQVVDVWVSPSQCITSLEHVPISFKVFHVNKSLNVQRCLGSLSRCTLCSKSSNNYAIPQFLSF